MTLALDLRAPLAVLQLNLDFIRDFINLPTADAEKMLCRCASSAAFINFMMNRSIDSCRALHGDKPVPSIEPIDLQELVRGTLCVLETYPKAVGIAFINEADAGVMDTFSCNQNWLMCILINLLTNACDATREGHIILSVHNDATMVSFDVLDTGVGVHEHDKERLFAPFSK